MGDVHFDEEVDTLVIGSGAAGCAAALGSLLHGAEKVLVVEKSKRLLGGTTRIAGGGWLWCPGNRYLQELGVTQSPDEIFDLLKDLAYPAEEDETPDEGDLELMRAFAEDWPAVIELIQREKLMELQVVNVRNEEEDAVRIEGLLRRKWANTAGFSAKTGISESNIKALSKLMPSYCAEHPLDLCPSGKVLAPAGGTTSRQLEKSVKRFGDKSEIRMGTQVVDVVLDAGGRCVGAKLLDVKSKAVSFVKARKGVVFGSGGFSHNRELLEANVGDSVMGSCAAPTNTGDFALICKSHGIPLSGMDQAWVKQVVLPNKFPERIGVFFLNGDSFFVADRTGKRFACEKNFYQQRGHQMLSNPDRKYVFYVFDKRSRDLYEGPIKSLGSPIPAKETGDDALVYGKDVAELAANLEAKMRAIDPAFQLDGDFGANLAAQLGRFNGFAETGRDLEFNRGDNVAEYCWHTPRGKDNAFPNKTMHPLDSKNLCALVMGLGTLDTKGGPRINRNGQILGADKKPVPGLYGAGNCVRSSTRKSYPASGATLSNAILFGFLAGRHALAPHQTKL